jgi:hypothetical protein
VIAALALALAQLAAPAASSVPTEKVVASPQAIAFAEGYVPAEATTRNAVASFRKEAERSLAAQPVFATLEQRVPDARRRIVDAGATAIERVYRDGLPALQRRVAAVAANTLSVADLAAVTAFIASPTGQAMQHAIAANVDTSKIVAASQNTGRISAEQMSGAIDIPGSLQALSPAQINELAAFGTSPAGRRFQQVVPALQAAIAEETNTLIQTGNPAVQEAIMMTMRSMAAPAKGK